MREISAAMLYEGEDSRFYVKVKLGQVEVEGLLDSGATVACLGRACLELLEKAGLQVFRFASVIKIADGSPHRIVGRVRAKVFFNKSYQEMDFSLLPSLNRELFLGVDFMKRFALFSNICSLTTSNISLCPESKEADKVKTHKLDPKQQFRLGNIIAKFPCYS